MVSVNAIQGTLIADNAITAVHIATNAVSGTLIADNAVTATHIAQNVITVTQLADDAVEADKIADGVITTNHLNSAMISSQTEVTAVAGDFALIGDTSDSNNLKKVPLSSIVALASSFDADAAQTFNDSGAAVDFRIEGDTEQNLFFVDGSADKVGIGTNSPSTLLHLGGTAPGDSIIRQDSTSSGTNWEIGERVAGKWQIFEDDGDSIVATFKSDGKVGIGTESPAQTLHTSGTGVQRIQVDATDNNAAGAGLYMKVLNSGSLVGNATVRVDNVGNINFFNGTSSESEKMRIDSSGRVGINRTPAITNAKLEVGGADNVPLINVEASGATAGFGIGSSKGKFYYGTSEACSFAVGDFYAGNIRLNGTSSNSNIESGNVHFKVGAGIWMSGSSSLDLQLQVPVTGVGISTAAKLDAPTGDWYTNDGSISSLSDSRLKKDITTLTDGMDIVKQLRPVTFKYDDNSLEEDGSKTLGAANNTTRYGFVAQEVETVAPQYVVSKEGKVKGETVSDLKSLSQTRMIPMLVKAIQELEAEVQALKG